MGTEDGYNGLDRPAVSLLGRTRQAVLELLFSHPGQAFYLRQIVRLTGAGHGAVQRELGHLVRAGVILREPTGHQVYYRANPGCPIYEELRGLLNKASGAAGTAGNSPTASVHQKDTTMTVQELLQRRRQDILRIAARHGVRRVRVFGSAVRGEADQDSDIDLLVEVGERTSPWFPVGLMEELQALLGRSVDVVTEESLHWLLRERILREAKPL